MFITRNREFYRDRAAFGWNFLFPFFIIIGFGIIFGGQKRALYKIGLFPSSPQVNLLNTEIRPDIKKLKYVDFIGFQNLEQGVEKLRHHKIDLLLEKRNDKLHYWVADTSPNGYVAEQLLKASQLNNSQMEKIRKEAITSKEIHYIDWLFPGILAMNMMFSALWGIGYIIVRYRKNGVLKRFSSTPLTAMEYLSAQMLSRVSILMISTIVVWIGCDFIFDFQVNGSYLNILLLFFLGSAALCSLGILIASRGVSEEFSSGLLNSLPGP
jgi:hypothetical protein